MGTKVEEREQWRKKREYILAVAGNVVGLGNVWRFPYLCYKNGGGVFLLPYLFFAVLCGVPLFLLETVIGQYTQEGAITCWTNLSPLSKGTGYSIIVIQLYARLYIIVLAWALLYLIHCFRATLPWATCNNPWNTDRCVDLTSANWTALHNGNLTGNTTSGNLTKSSVSEFWERGVLSMSGGIDEVGTVKWELLLCLLACWVACYFCIWKGVRSTGKFTGLETITSSVIDMFPGTIRRPWRREIFILLFCSICFIIQIPLTTQGGIYLFQLVDYYGANGACILFVSLVQCVAVGWAFGAERMCDAVEEMTGQRPWVLFKLCWLYFTPLICMVGFICSFVDYQPLTIGGYVYPDWAYYLGWAMALSSVVVIPIWALGKICLTKGSLRQRLLVLWLPDSDPVGPKKKKENVLNETEMKPMSDPVPDML
ncbi:sodium- and chloride-dependent GABA transporter 2-like [Paralichthys olivaceus]|uniref:sodium- and chloride-dependent GABA transporter 2-like n=1 Tax=Paralichthys olivaceus TaxID=8255 RepID=UPI003751853C